MIRQPASLAIAACLSGMISFGCSNLDEGPGDPAPTGQTDGVHELLGPSCGNGILDAIEGCDDGNTADGDGCSSNCLVESMFFCNNDGFGVGGLDGDNSCAPGLVCDTTGNSLPGVCEPIGCGDGEHSVGEACDDGDVLDGDGCDSLCLIEAGFGCNDDTGLLNDASCASGLVCDDVGNGVPGLCEVNGCGDGDVDPDEGCDDGDIIPGDGCGATCLIETGFVCNDTMLGQTGDGSCESGVCDTVGNGAPGVCEAPGCGDGNLDADEGCDDGNTMSGDGCSATCLIETGFACNDMASGLIDDASCESGICDTVGNGAPGVCEAQGCGDGNLDADEGCDDGNTMSGDGCSATCLIENGFACNDMASGLMDDGSCESGICDTVGNSAPGVCEAQGCGDGNLDAGEGCDDGNTMSGDGCSAACQIENGFACNGTAPGLMDDASCESGICDTVGNGAPGVCEPSGCGDGILAAGEGCDDGNTVATDGCGITCLIETGQMCNATPPGDIGSNSCESMHCDPTSNTCEMSGCGDGVLALPEGCDDGNTVAGDGCNGACKIETGQACNDDMTGTTGDGSCATGICDDVGNPAPGICEDISVCGNNVVEANEGCDDGNTSANDGCSDNCLIENGGACNGTKPGETGDNSCESGVCDDSDNPDPGVCEPTDTCGNSVVEAGEGCDDGNTVAGDGCGATCLLEDGEACNDTTPGETGNDSCESGVCDDDENPAPGVCEPADTCGNGQLDADEGCDDGNTDSDDGCSADCLIEADEPCNDVPPGQTGDDSCETMICNTEGGEPGICQGAGCGNGVLEADEGCDDGNTVDGDGCNASCRIENSFECNVDSAGLVDDASCASDECRPTGICSDPIKVYGGACDARSGVGDGGLTILMLLAMWSVVARRRRRAMRA